MIFKILIVLSVFSGGIQRRLPPLDRGESAECGPPGSPPCRLHVSRSCHGLLVGCCPHSAWPLVSRLFLEYFVLSRKRYFTPPVYFFFFPLVFSAEFSSKSILACPANPVLSCCDLPNQCCMLAPTQPSFFFEIIGSRLSLCGSSKRRPDNVQLGPPSSCRCVEADVCWDM